MKTIFVLVRAGQKHRLLFFDKQKTIKKVDATKISEKDKDFFNWVNWSGEDGVAKK